MARGAVLSPPYTAARVFLEWAIDLWPYVNGKAIVAGLSLKEMNSSEMVDVIHYFFEDDFNVGSGETLEAISEMRKVVYETLYNTPYNYAIKTSNKDSFTASKGPYDTSFNDLTPFDPASQPTKPYVPPTEFQEDSPLPFGSALDGPLG